ncbi:MAG TPA: zincin-like metallopeptidase domain-containing protein [Caulobacteraceae bacterium]
MFKHDPSNERFDVYRTITDKIVAAIEAGTDNFVMPWHRAGPALGRPANAKSRMRYRGVNVVALWAEAAARGYGSGWWATFDQWSGIGGRIRHRERGTTVVFWKRIEGAADKASDDETPAGTRLVARAFRVFNADQIDGWRPPVAAVASPVELRDQAEAFVASTGAVIRHGGDQACYRWTDDVVQMPDRRLFVGSPTCDATEAYYSTLLHELTHWSGAKHRLDRAFSARFGDEAYAVEELVAELGAAFLCADLEITNEPRPDHAAYVAHWLKVLGDDPRAIFLAATKAKDAAAYLGALPGTPVGD